MHTTEHMVMNGEQGISPAFGDNYIIMFGVLISFVNLDNEFPCVGKCFSPVVYFVVTYSLYYKYSHVCKCVSTR